MPLIINRKFGEYILINDSLLLKIEKYPGYIEGVKLVFQSILPEEKAKIHRIPSEEGEAMIGRCSDLDKALRAEG